MRSRVRRCGAERGGVRQLRIPDEPVPGVRVDVNSLLALSAAFLSASPVLAFVLQTVGIGSAVGTAVALRAKLKSDRDAWPITAAWGSAGLAIGVVAQALAALLHLL